MFGGVESLLMTLTRAREFGSGLSSHFGVCFEGELTDRLSQKKVPWKHLGEAQWGRPWTLLQARRQLKNWLQSEKFDAFICHSTWPHAIFSGTLKRTRPETPLFFWIHDQPTRHWLEKLAQRHPPEAVIAGSDYIGSQAGMVFRNTPVRIAHIPVEDRAVPANEREACRRKIREELETSMEDRVFILAGRMAELKGHSVLLEALARLQRRPGFQEEVPWKLWIAGQPQNEEEQAYFQQLQTQAKHSGIGSRIQFLGFRRDIPELFCAADWYCQPNTLPESFGISFVEALYSGLPVLTSDIGGGKEIVTQECGLLTPPSDVVELEAALKKILGPGGGQFGRILSPNCRPRAHKLCDPVQQFLRIEKALTRRSNYSISNLES